jgi:hypothetical protein
MKIRDILKEDEESTNVVSEVEKLSKILRKHCRDVYKNFYSKDVSQKFRHSASNLPEGIFKVVKNKEDRKPTDTPEYFHNIMDDALQKELGERFRSNALFTYYKDFSSSSYVVFPFDGYKIATSDTVNDMYILVRDYLNSGEIEKMYVDFIEDYVDLSDDHAKVRADLVPNYVFNLLPRESWLKQKDFPNLDTFIGVFETSAKQILGNDAKFLASKEKYKSLFDKTLSMTEKYIRSEAAKYKLVHEHDDIDITTVKYNELMIHADRFVLVNTADILRYLVDKGHDFSENDVITMLYKNDLTAFE